MARAYDKRGRLLAQRANSYIKTHPIQAYFASKVGKPANQYLHAEIACLIAAKEPVYKLEIERYDAKGLPALAKPCVICQAAVEAWGVKVVHYTGQEL